MLFNPDAMAIRYSKWESIIRSSVQDETSDYSFLNSYADFGSALSELNDHAASRYSSADAYAN